MTQTGQRIAARLTQKEKLLVVSIAAGRPYREVGQSVGTTEQVVKNYLRNIFRKTGTSNRLELVTFLIHHGVLSCPCGSSQRPLAHAIRALRDELRSLDNLLQTTFGPVPQPPPTAGPASALSSLPPARGASTGISADVPLGAGPSGTNVRRMQQIFSIQTAAKRD